MSSRPHTRRRTRLRRALTAFGALATVAALPLMTGTASAASSSDWQRLAGCESGGNWHINTGNGYYGGLQFSSGTWLAYGGGAYAGRADLASPDQQMAIADKVLAAQGWNAWPACSRSTGLYGSSTRPTPAPTPAPAPLVGGAIGQRYAALGGAGGLLGAPLTPETSSARGGRYNVFQHGSIYWTPATGAWEVHGDIRADWAALGWENSPLGFPTSNEQRTPNRVGAYNVFEHGTVYWSPTTRSHEVRGLIFNTWASLGFENSVLGFPTNDELPTPSRPGAYSTFEGGTIYFSPSTGAHEVRGAIFLAWGGQRLENGPLGFPTSGEYAVPGGRRSDFEHGSITWTPAKGAVVHLS